MNNHTDSPLVSIITVTYNCKDFVAETVESVLNQTYHSLEYIIIDGESTDGTLEEIKSYGSEIDTIISEPDRGIYDAINKGIERSSGSIIGILHAGDSYTASTIEKVVAAYSKHDNSILFGDTVFINKQHEEIGYQKGSFNEEEISKGFGFMHPSAFVPKVIYENIGTYNIDYPYAGDVDFLLRAYRAGYVYHYSGHQVHMMSDGTSEKNFKQAKLDYFRVIEDNNYLPPSELKKAKAKFFLKYYLIKKYLDRETVHKVKLQLKYFLVWFYNLIYAVIPTFFLKNKLLELSGVTIGRKSYIHHGTTFLSIGKLEIGNNVVINNQCLLDNRNKIKIGDNVNVAHSTKIYTTGHDIDSPYFTGKRKQVEIQDYCCIFSSALIMPGVQLGKGTVVLPGAVVTKSTEPYAVVGGNPAQRIRTRSKDLRYNLDHGYWFSS